MPMKTATTLPLLALLLLLPLAGGCRRTAPAAQQAELEAAPSRSAQAARELSGAQARARRHPNDAAAQLAAGKLGLKYGANNDAYRAFRRVAELDPENGEALVGLAQVNLRLQNPTEGLSWAERARRLKPRDPELTELQARLLLVNGNFDRSVKVFREALALAPQRTSTWLNLASAYALMNRRTEAVQAAQQAVRLDPQSPAAYFALGRHLQRADQAAAAEQAYRDALRLDAGNAPTMIALARLLMDGKRRLDEARQLAVRASQISTDRADAAIIAAWILHLQHNDQGATNELIKIVNGTPQNPEGWEKLAVCLRGIGRTKEATNAETMARQFVAGSPTAIDLQAIQGQ